MNKIYRVGVFFLNDKKDLNDFIHFDISTKCKCYEFTAITSNIISGYVYAESESDACDKIDLGNWEEIEKTKLESVEEITKIKEIEY